MNGARGQLVDDASALEAHRKAWDDLAVSASLPFCAPGWLLPWWHHADRGSAQLRVVLVLDGDALIGLAPFYSERAVALTRWRPLGAGACERVEPLAAPGREGEVAREIARVIAEQMPHVVTFEGVSRGCRWPHLLAEAWPGPGRPWIGRRARSVALTVNLAERSFDAWFMQRTSHFRQRLRKSRKLLLDGGGAARLATQETLGRDVESFIRLHGARWEGRGGSGALTPGVVRMLRAAVHELPAGERLRVWSLDLNGKTIASSVALVAGKEIGYWLNGFDAEHAAISPARLSILTVIEDAFGLGADRLDLGEGDFAYKRRFADAEETLQWLWLVPPGRRRPLIRMALAAALARRGASARLAPRLEAGLRRAGLRGGSRT